MANNINANVTATIQLSNQTVAGTPVIYSQTLNPAAFLGNDYQALQVTIAAPYTVTLSGAAFCSLLYVRNLTPLTTGQNLQVTLYSSVSNLITFPVTPQGFQVLFNPGNPPNGLGEWPFQLDFAAYAGSSYPITLEYVLCSATTV